MRSQTTKKKLLSEDRTFDQALKVAQADELAEKESKLLQGNSNSSSAGILPVNAVHKKIFLLKKAKGKQILSQKWEESSVFGVALHNIWLTSAVMSNLHVITVGSLGIWLRHASRKRKNLLVTTPLTK